MLGFCPSRDAVGSIRISPNVGNARANRPSKVFSGFTLVELLVVIAIIGVLVALLLPAVQSSRESARRIQCKNQLHNLALAVLNYESERGVLPSASEAVESNRLVNVRTGTQISWIVRVLPYVEQQALFDQFDLNRHVKDQPESEPQSAQPNLLLCPSDSVRGRVYQSPRTRDRPFAKANYAAYVSPEHAECQAVAKGAMIHRPQPLRKIQDGMSNTLMLTEVRTRYEPDDQRGAWAMGAVGCSVLAADIHGTDRATRICKQDPIPTYYPRDIWAEFALLPNSGVSPTTPRDDLLYCPDPAAADLEGMPCWTRGDTTAAARSLHLGGVNVANVDGSVAWMPDDVDAVVYGSRICIDDGLVVGQTE